jgi:hypothetical protein
MKKILFFVFLLTIMFGYSNVIMAQTCTDYDFNCDGKTTNADLDVIAKYWQNGTQITMNIVTGAKCKPLVDFLAPYWQQNLNGGQVAMNDVTLIGKEIAKCTTDCSLLKCPNAYFDEKLQECACGQSSLNTVGKEEVITKVIYSDKEGKVIFGENVIKEKEGSINKVEITTEENKKFIFVKEGSQESTLESKKEIKTSGSVSVKEGKTYLNDKEVKIMPDTASEKAIQTQQINKEITVELKDTGKPIYEVSGKKQVKLFGLFKKEMLIKSEIDGNTGEVISVKKPWWNFFSR